MNEEEFNVESQWKRIWNQREDHLGVVDASDKKAMFLEMKRMDGFDITDGGIPYDSLMKQYHLMKEELCLQEGESVFEVGCGCGANLYLLHEDGLDVGGLDYSAALLEAMRKAFPEHALKECICDEAIHLPTDEKYHAVFANGVFSYFPDLQYAEAVLERMLAKSIRSIGILDVLDVKKQEAFIQYRLQNTPDYEERYRDLPKLFYPRTFFEEFASSHGMNIQLIETEMDGYWNSGFAFDCYLHK